jgi:hypothetical protein
MDPYNKFIQSEYENLRFLTVVPQKKYQPTVDFRLNSTDLVKKGATNSYALVPVIRPPLESSFQQISYKPYDEDVHTLTTQLPPLLPQGKQQKQNQLTKPPTKFNITYSTTLSHSELEELNKRVAPGHFNNTVVVPEQHGSSDSLALLPKPNTYKERTTKSTTYETDVKRHYINIDTKFRNKPELTTSTNFRWRLFRPIKNCVSLRVASVEIPNNFYTFSAAKKNILFYAKLTASPSYTTLTLSEGNFLSTEFSDSLQTLLQTVDANFTVTISNITGKLSIENPTNAFDIQFPREDTASTFDWGLGYYMGFNNTSYTNQTTLTGERVVNLVGDNYIMLQIGDYEGIEHEVEKQGLISATAKIILTSDKYAILFDNGSNFLSKEVAFQLPTNISAFNVRLIDSNNNDIDLMGTNYSFTLELVEIVNSRLYTNYSDNLLQNTDTPR